MLNSIFNNSIVAEISVTQLLLCTVASLIMGVLLSVVYMYKNTYTKNFAVTLAILPVMVQVVIMVVNGNLGTGVAVAGAFSLVRFRSLPGNSRDIASIFAAVAIGLATGTGFIAIAAALFITVGLMTLILCSCSFGENKNEEKDLRITIPESLDYTGAFDEIMAKYTTKNKLIKVRTTNMGSLYELKYKVIMKNSMSQKDFIDELRCKNSNLNIICSEASWEREEI